MTASELLQGGQPRTNLFSADHIRRWFSAHNSTRIVRFFSIG